MRYNKTKMMNAREQFFIRLQKQIEKAELEHRPICNLVKKQIKLLKEAHDEFISAAKAKGYNLNNSRIAEIEVQQYSSMKQLAKKIGLPVEEYDELIKQVRIRVFGEENYKRFFENP